jgi:hypothetical protein
VAVSAGDVLTLATLSGPAEARRIGRAEAGQSRWSIKAPWGAEIFYGTAEQAEAQMKKRSAEHDAIGTGRT